MAISSARRPGFLWEHMVSPLRAAPLSLGSVDFHHSFASVHCSFFFFLIYLFKIFFFFLIFLLYHAACVILVLLPGNEPEPPALKAWSLNHWTTRKFLLSTVLCTLFPGLDARPVFWAVSTHRHALPLPTWPFCAADVQEEVSTPTIILYPLGPWGRC